MIHQEWDVLSSISKGRDVEPEWAEVLEEPIAKSAIGDIVFEVTSRSRDDSEIYRAGFR
jgi:hypothetical protein